MESTNPISEPSTNHQRKAHRKPRLPLSCDPCRSRKLKCNRESPCQNCTVRKERSKCIYKNTKQGVAASAAIRYVQRDAMQQRLDRLEHLVTSLASQKGDGGHPQLANGMATSSDAPQPAIAQGAQHSAFGTMKVDNDHSLYQGSTHWSDVLHEMDALKSAWLKVQDEEDFNMDTVVPMTEWLDGPSLLCGLSRPIDVSEMWATLPPKAAVDKLLAKFFNTNDPSVPYLPILHEPTFMKQYAEHWEYPAKTSLMWLGMLFSMLNLTMLGYHHYGGEPPEYEGVSESLAELYRLRTAQCLMMADITKCAPYTLETLLFNSIAELSRRKENARGVWIMIGIIVRAAIQMGYHRDPSQYPEISVFQGELRRRVWCLVAECDSLSSFVVGLPSMIKDVDNDTAEPRNIFDWELAEDMTELPPSRPTEEITPVGYLIAKSRILGALGSIVDFLNSLQPQSYDTVLILDEKLARAHEDIPTYLRMPTLEEALRVSSAAVAGKIQLEFNYHQGMCVLHRKFLSSSRHDNRFAQSRKRCLESAMALLAMQSFLHDESDIRGGRQVPQWYRVTMCSQYLILPATLVFLDLRFRKEQHDLQSPTPWEMNDEEIEMLRSLEIALMIWKKGRGTSVEAEKFQRVLARMLKVFDTTTTYDVSHNKHKIVHTSAESGPLPPNLLASMDTLAVDENGSMNPAMAPNMEVDWTAWNSFIEGASFDDAYMSMSFEDQPNGNGNGNIGP